MGGTVTKTAPTAPLADHRWWITPGGEWGPKLQRFITLCGPRAAVNDERTPRLECWLRDGAATPAFLCGQPSKYSRD